MKHKRSASFSPLKIHALLFTIFTLLMSHSMLATFTYPSNTLLSFDHFKFFVIERVTLILMWSIVLVIHFGIHYMRSGWQARQYADAVDTQHLEAHAEEEIYPDARKAKLH